MSVYGTSWTRRDRCSRRASVICCAERISRRISRIKPGRTRGEIRHRLNWPAEFGRLRAESLTLLSKVGEGDLNRTARHQELGMVTLGEMIHQWAGHDLVHTVQGERAIMQQYIDGCGPWKRYFSDHAVPPSTQGGR